jgi:hypothetical protein
MDAFDEEMDLLVVGSGAAALTAAIVAADNHAKVAVIEKSDQFGGTSATSGGVIWIPASHLAKAAGADDSPDEAARYIDALASVDAEPDRIRAFVDNAPRMLAYMEERTRCATPPSPIPTIMPNSPVERWAGAATIHSPSTGGGLAMTLHGCVPRIRRACYSAGSAGRLPKLRP